ncbi:polysaccharide pyruvyl transferase family protein [Rhodococcus sp. 5G237]
MPLQEEDNLRDVNDFQRILVLWADQNSTNLGVQALAAGTRQLARRLAPEASVEFLSYGGIGGSPRLGLKSIVGASIGGSSTLTRFLSQFDLVIDTGAGDSFADIYGMRRHVEMSLLRNLVSRLGIPLVMGPQTVGPFEHKMATALASWSIRNAALVIGRDSVSVNTARRIHSGVITHGSDVVFLIEQPTDKCRHDVILNVSGLLWNENPHVDAVYYRSVVTRLVASIKESGHELTLLAHVLDSDNADNDMVAIRELQKSTGEDFRVVQPTDLDHARAEISGANVLIASRMHAALNALSTGVPAIPWAYSRKFEPLLADLGWEYYFDLRRRDPRIVEDTIAVLPKVMGTDSIAQDIRDLAVRRVLDASHTLSR